MLASLRSYVTLWPFFLRRPFEKSAEKRFISTPDLLAEKEFTYQESERLGGLVFVPVVATTLFYALPDSLQSRATVQFLPQLIAYVSLAVWVTCNSSPLTRLGLSRNGLRPGILWGGATGILLGCLNTAVILWGGPTLGWDITFLRQTPHAQLPTAVMLPWAIFLIAWLVELNFRGFLLGRLLTLSRHCPIGGWPGMGPALAVVTSAIVFAFDPFMVTTFKHLHWIAFWDGLIWGLLWIRLRNLYATMVAHAVEVMIMYSTLKWVLDP